MSTALYITDDGDEKVFIKVNEDLVMTVDHEAYGWGGMRSVLEGIEAIAEAFNIPVRNTQDIV